MITGDVFIVPNKAQNVGKNKSSDFWVSQRSKTLNTIGIDIMKLDDNDDLVEVWCCSVGSDNWQSHDLPTDLKKELKETTGGVKKHSLFPSYIPRSMMKELKEGESFEVVFGGVSVTLTARQLSYRYRTFGSFEDTLNKI